MLRLQAGELACELDPQRGGCVLALRLGGIDVLRPAATRIASARQAAAYPLVPWSNRIGQARMHWQGRTWPLAPNDAPKPHAIHGIGWQRPWQLLRHDATGVDLALRHAPDASWPFAFRALQSLHLAPHALQLALSLTNTGDTIAPAGLGWHPFFAKRAAMTLRFRATGRWEMGPDQLPTQRAPHAGLDEPCALLDVDHCFDGWDGVAELRDPLLHIRLSAGATRLVAFTTPARDAVALEPVTHVNNALGAAAPGAPEALGVVALAPGATLELAVRLEVRRSAPPQW